VPGDSTRPRGWTPARGPGYESPVGMRLSLAAELRAAGFVAAQMEADELLARAGGDAAALDAMLDRRLRGEPLAWVTGSTVFCGRRLRVAPGVYVPRPHTELLARRAVERCPPDGVAVDLCTGCGAVAAVVAAERPGARVIATDADDRAVACARANGVDARVGDLFAPLAGGRDGAVDVVVAVVPYVPTPELRLLHRDTFAFEAQTAYDGGPDGTRLLRRVVAGAPRLLRRGGTLLLELGGDQPDLLAPDLAREGFTALSVLRDEDGDVRGVEATLG
jgi:release factor glutamine methyltransferase